MAQQPSAQGVNPNVGHPILRELLVLAVNIALPLAEQWLASFLASRGIFLPPMPPANPAPGGNPAGGNPANQG